jgi:hypothetical protein
LGNTMDSTNGQTADDLLIPSTIYTWDDIQDGSLPSLAYSPGKLGDLSLFLSMPPLQTLPSQIVDGFGRTGKASPDYPSAIDEWQEGLQAIEDFDWPTTDQLHEATPESDEKTLAVPRVEQPSTSHDTREGAYDDLSNIALNLPTVHKGDQQVKSPSPLSENPLSPWIGKLLEEQLDISTPDDEEVSPEVDHDLTTPNIVIGNDVCEDDSIPSETSFGPEVDDMDQDDGIDLVDAESTHEVYRGATSMSPYEACLRSLSWNIPELEEAVPESLKAQNMPVLTSEQDRNITVIEDSPRIIQEIIETSEEAPQDPTPELAMSLPSSTQCNAQSTCEHTEPVVEHEKLEEQALLEDGSESPLSSPNESDAMSTDGDADQDQHLSGRDAPNNILLVPTSTEESEVKDIYEEQSVPEDTTSTLEDVDNGKRVRAVKSDGSSDTEGGAPPKKKVKGNSTLSSDDDVFEDALENLNLSDVAPVEEPIKRLTSTKSPKESSKNVVGNSSSLPRHEEEKKLVSQADLKAFQVLMKGPKSSDEKATRKQAVAYTQQNTQSKADDSATGTQSGDELVKSSQDDDYDMREHYSDVHDSPPMPPNSSPDASKRIPRPTVSNRELVSLGSSLKPSMHLDLHRLQYEAPPVRARKTTTMPEQFHFTDSDPLLDQPWSSETGKTRAVTKNKRPASTSTSKTGAPKKAKIEPPEKTFKPRAAIGIKTEQRSGIATEVTDEEQVPMIQTRKDSHVSIELPKTLSNQKTKQPAKGKAAAPTATQTPANKFHPYQPSYGKRHTRGDTLLDTARSTSAYTPAAPTLPSQNNDADASSDDADPLAFNNSEPSVPKLNKGKKVLKKATPSLAHTSTPAPDDDASDYAATNSDSDDSDHVESDFSEPDDPKPKKGTKGKKTVTGFRKASTPALSVASSVGGTPIKNKYGFNKCSPRRLRSKDVAGAAMKTPAPKKLGAKADAAMTTPAPKKTGKADTVKQTVGRKAKAETVGKTPAKPKGAERRVTRQMEAEGGIEKRLRSRD